LSAKQRELGITVEEELDEEVLCESAGRTKRGMRPNTRTYRTTSMGRGT
jgi:hypothetical protein